MSFEELQVDFHHYRIDIICSASVVQDDEETDVTPTKTSNRGRRKRKSKEKDDKDTEEDVEQATSSKQTKKRRSLQYCVSVLVMLTCTYVCRTGSNSLPEEASLDLDTGDTGVLELSQ